MDVHGQKTFEKSTSVCYAPFYKANTVPFVKKQKIGEFSAYLPLFVSQPVFKWLDIVYTLCIELYKMYSTHFASLSALNARLSLFTHSQSHIYRKKLV